MADSSTGGLINDLLMPTYYSGVLQRSSPKNYVMHPVILMAVVGSFAS
jgi:hypothetical protein